MQKIDKLPLPVNENLIQRIPEARRPKALTAVPKPGCKSAAVLIARFDAERWVSREASR